MVSLIDRDMMIDLSHENADAANYLDSLNDPAISIVTAQELIVGARDKRDLYAIDSLVSTYRVIHIDAAIGKLAYELLKRYARSDGLRTFDSDRRHGDRPGLRARQQEQKAFCDDRRPAV
jgi:predicted nucleic acid-binding protein